MLKQKKQKTHPLSLLSYVLTAKPACSETHGYQSFIKNNSRSLDIPHTTQKHHSELIPVKNEVTDGQFRYDIYAA